MGDAHILYAVLRPTGRGLKQRTVRGIGWLTVSTATRIALTLVSMPVLARLLTPGDYGIVALSTLVIEVVALFGEFGLHSALIQRKRISRLDLETAFWTNVAIGIGLAIVVTALAPLAVRFFDTPALALVIYVSAIGLVLTSFASVHHTVLMRAMRFREVAIIEIASVMVRVASAIGLALHGAGYWALVGAGLCGLLTAAVLRLLIVRWLPRMTYRGARLRSMLSFGKNVFADQLLSYLGSNVDYVIVGKRLGPEPLGAYQMAFSLPEMVRNSLSQVVSRVMFPAYSRAQDDNPRIAAAFLQVVRAASLVSFPTLAGLLFVAPLFVPLYFGAQWNHIIVPLQFLCISGGLRAVAATTGSVYHAKGRPDLTFKINLVRVPVLALAIWIGSRWGINGVAFAFMAVALTWTFVSATWTARLLRMRRRDIYFAMAPAVTASAGMIAGLWGLRMTIFSDFSDLRMLSALVVSGALLYFGLLSAFWRSTLIDMAGLMRHLRQQPVR